jgi:hypothetical protein
MRREDLLEGDVASEDESYPQVSQYELRYSQTEFPLIQSRNESFEPAINTLL